MRNNWRHNADRLEAEKQREPHNQLRNTQRALASQTGSFHLRANIRTLRHLLFFCLTAECADEKTFSTASLDMFVSEQTAPGDGPMIIIQFIMFNSRLKSARPLPCHGRQSSGCDQRPHGNEYQDVGPRYVPTHSKETAILNTALNQFDRARSRMTVDLRNLITDQRGLAEGCGDSAGRKPRGGA